jgi:enolase-phosphatase E1
VLRIFLRKARSVSCNPIVTLSPPTKQITAFLLDIEGTTTPIDFVYEVLFPYARTHVRAYLEDHLSSEEHRSDIASLLEENAEDARSGLNPPLIERPDEHISIDSIVAYVHWLMDRDRKTTALKSIQGRIWNNGYNSGDLHSQVFEDVPRAFARWQEQRKAICIYSSGSVLAQKLLFAHTEAGDLAPFISGFFDTNIGPKRETESYGRIASALKLPPREIVFVSDVTAELDAAADAGFETLLCVRPGNPSQPASAHVAIQSFDQIP